MDLLDTLGTELDIGRKVLDTLGLVQGGLDKGRLDDAGLAVEGSDERVGESGASYMLAEGKHLMSRLTVTHGEGGRSGTSLGLDNLCGSAHRRCYEATQVRTVTTKLDPVNESLVLLALDVGTLASLAQKRDNGDTGVSTDDSDVDVLGVGVLDLAEESRGSDDVEGGDTEESLLVEDTSLLEDLGEDRDGRVDRVGDDEDVSLGGVLGNGLGEVTDDRGVGVLASISPLCVCYVNIRRGRLGSFPAFGGHQPG